MKPYPIPQSILFVCQLNSVRSPMAEGLMRAAFPNVGDIRSCGLYVGDVNDFMVTVMREKGIDMSGHNPSALADFQDMKFEHVIAFTQDTYDAAQTVFSEQPETVVEFWPVVDPGEGSLDVRAMLNNYRAIRDNIDARLRRSFIETE
jgi:protein-tyrosine-phosphatase